MTVNVVSDKVMKFVEQNVSKESINMDNKQQHTIIKRVRDGVTDT
jgi:ERCC4-related helicase